MRDSDKTPVGMVRANRGISGTAALLMASYAQFYSLKEPTYKFKLKGSHTNAKPLPKPKKRKKRGY
jgi:hypothetical protein